MPGVMQVEAKAQVASLLLFKLTKTTSRIGYFMSADSVKFRKPVFPGDTMFIHAELTKSRGERMAKTKCHCVVNDAVVSRSEEHTSELQSHSELVCRLLLEKKNPVIDQGDLLARLGVHGQQL